MVHYLYDRFQKYRCQIKTNVYVINSAFCCFVILTPKYLQYHEISYNFLNECLRNYRIAPTLSMVNAKNANFKL